MFYISLIINVQLPSCKQKCMLFEPLPTGDTGCTSKATGQGSSVTPGYLEWETHRWRLLPKLGQKQRHPAKNWANVWPLLLEFWAHTVFKFTNSAIIIKGFKQLTLNVLSYRILILLLFFATGSHFKWVKVGCKRLYTWLNIKYIFKINIPDNTAINQNWIYGSCLRAISSHTSFKSFVHISASLHSSKYYHNLLF